MLRRPPGRLERRTTRAADCAQLARLDPRYAAAAGVATISNVGRLRRQAIATLEESPSCSTREAAQRDLDELVCRHAQFTSYPADYLAGNPSLERLAETLDKLEEDVLEVPTARPAAFDERSSPSASPSWPSPTAIANRRPSSWTDALESRVQELLDLPRTGRPPCPSQRCTRGFVRWFRGRMECGAGCRLVSPLPSTKRMRAWKRKCVPSTNDAYDDTRPGSCWHSPHPSLR